MVAAVAVVTVVAGVVVVVLVVAAVAVVVGWFDVVVIIVVHGLEFLVETMCKQGVWGRASTKSKSSVWDERTQVFLTAKSQPLSGIGDPSTRRAG